jgi:hypothetical protein
MKKLIAIIFSALPLFASAQADGFMLEAVGSVSPVVLSDVKKKSEQAVPKDTTLPAPAFTYTLQSKRYLTTVQIDTIKAAKLGAEPVSKLYRTYARLGVGNYASLLGEFYVSSLRSKTGAWGAHVRHFSSGTGPKDVAGAESGFNQQDINIFGKRFLKRHTLYGGFDYDRDVVYNYGSAASSNSFDKASTRQRFTYTAIGGRLQSHYTDSTAINHVIGLRYYHLGDRYKVKEDNVLVEVDANRYIRTERLSLGIGVDYNRNAGETDTAASTIVKFQPAFSARGKKFDASIGLGIYYDGGENLTYFQPQASFSYDIVNHIIVPYLSMGGYLERNSYRSLSLVNPFIMSGQSFMLRNTLHKFELRLGLRGSLTADLAYDVNVMRVELVDAPFFVNTSEQQDIFRNKFAIVYDKANVVNVHGQLAWQRFERMRFTATGDWFHYTMATEEKPWHTPTLRLALIGEYNVQDKILARTQIYFLNGQYAKLVESTGTTVVNLKGLIDVNLGFEYRYTPFL